LRIEQALTGSMITREMIVLKDWKRQKGGKKKDVIRGPGASRKLFPIVRRKKDGISERRSIKGTERERRSTPKKSASGRTVAGLDMRLPLRT